MQGDTIWFKAYAWFGFSQFPDTVSKVLYVDLLSSKGKIEIKKKFLIKNGTSSGDFTLDKAINPGKYIIRAYTRWMQNDNTGEPFYQTVTINGSKEDFQVECIPRVIKQADGDSLQVAFRFYELDRGGDLRNDFNHKVSYSVRIGERRLETGEGRSETGEGRRDKGEVMAANAKEQVFKCKLPGIGENDSVAILNLTIKDERLTFEKQFRIPLKEELDLQFFPEGGLLVNGIESRIAFKALGIDGLSREVKGVIKDEKGELVTSIESSHKGMGDFLFIPEKDKKYAAWIEHNHRLSNFPLPSAEDEGFAMSVNYSDLEDTVYVRVKYSPSKKDEKILITGSAYGKIRFISNIKTTSDSSMVGIPVKLLPEGISRITLFDSNFKPLSERLIYNDKGERFRVEVIPDSIYYGLRSKVTLRVKTSDADSNPLSTDLSLAVVAKEQVAKDGGGSGISAYKLLESELKGYVEDAGSYFSDNRTNLKALDLLLLSQGYRSFLPEKIKPAGIKYFPERSFDITGKAALRGNKNKDKKNNYNELVLNLLCSSNSYFDQTKADSLGAFSFHIPLQYGKPLSLIRAYTSTGKLSKTYLDDLMRGNSAYTSTGRLVIPKEKSFRGDIFIDEPVKAPIFTPPLYQPEITSPFIDYVHQLQEAKKSELSKIANGIQWQLNLPEFTVTGKDKNWYTNFEGEANKIADLDSLDTTGQKYDNVFDLLVKEFGAWKTNTLQGLGVRTVTLPSYGLESHWFPIYLLNGETYLNWGEHGKVPFLLNQLSVIRVNEIKRIMVIPPGNLSYHYAEPSIRVLIKQSLVNVETYPRHSFYRGDPDGIKTFILEGLDTPRVFYSPRYEGATKDSKVYDGRATLYWNPAVRTNDKGEAKVEFYTGDCKTGMEVIVNGIEIGNGFTGQKETMINMNRRQ